MERASAISLLAKALPWPNQLGPRDCHGSRGAMKEFLAAAPSAEVAHGAVGCMVSIDDLCDRPPHKLADGEVIDLGGKQVRHIDTPHVPHNWEARVIFEQTTRTLFCGDYLPTPATDRRLLTMISLGLRSLRSRCFTPLRFRVQPQRRSADLPLSNRRCSRSCTALRRAPGAAIHFSHSPMPTTR